MPPLQLKQEFPSLKSFKEALYIWAIEQHFEPRILKSDSHHVRVGCKFDPKCEFSIRCNAYNASPRVPSPYAKITVLRHGHTCTPGDPTNPLNRQVANRIPWLVENVPRFLDVTPQTSIESIQEAILRNSGYTVNLQQIRRVRRLLVKGKDFRSPMREHGGLGSQGMGSAHEISLGRHQGSQNGGGQAHSGHSGSVNGGGSVGGNGNGGGVHTHPHPHPHPHPPPHPQTHSNPSPYTRPSPNSHTHSHNPSPLLQVQEPNPPVPSEEYKDYTTTRSNYEDHSTLIGALTTVNDNQQSNNMFDVNNPPPPRIIEAPVMSNGPGSVGRLGEAPIRCPFCVNLRWMKSIKDAVDHMAMHVV